MGFPQYSHPQAVKRRQPKLTCSLTPDQRLDPLAHFTRGFVGKCDSGNLAGVKTAIADQVGNFVGDDTRLARARTG